MPLNKEERLALEEKQLVPTIPKRCLCCLRIRFIRIGAGFRICDRCNKLNTGTIDLVPGEPLKNPSNNKY